MNAIILSIMRFSATSYGNISFISHSYLIRISFMYEKMINSLFHCFVYNKVYTQIMIDNILHSYFKYI